MRTAKGIALVALLIATGCEGPTGPQGEAGPQGTAGPQGAAGQRGTQGLQGKDGVSFYLADFSSEGQLLRWTKRGVGSYRVQDGELVVRGGADGLLESVVSGTQFSDNLDVTVTTRWLSGDQGFSYG